MLELSEEINSIKNVSDNFSLTLRVCAAHYSVHYFIYLLMNDGAVKNLNSTEKYLHEVLKAQRQETVRERVENDDKQNDAQ